jgi:hypothetical protein
MGCTAHLRHLHALRLCREHCEKERLLQQRAKAQAAAAEQEAVAAAERGLNTTYTADDLNSALQKVTDAAVRSVMLLLLCILKHSACLTRRQRLHVAEHSLW